MECEGDMKRGGLQFIVECEEDVGEKVWGLLWVCSICRQKVLGTNVEC